ncbi:hypothetical protein ACFFIY_00770 [Bhargavaea ullalensis]|uniref:Uncharacterized protein YdeI (BOF family) n=1 Tax=Bhargavaea ullalensis TaxID=1265685 RepID=A0ABV2GDE3_9BACL
MKRLSFILLGGLLLGACSNDDKPPVTSTESISPPASGDKKSQSEINDEFMASAEEITFDSASTGDIEEGTHVRIRGEVTGHSALGGFMLKDPEGDGEIAVTNLDTTDTALEDGDIVTVYGTFGGTDKDDQPEINATVIEKQ